MLQLYLYIEPIIDKPFSWELFLCWQSWSLPGGGLRAVETHSPILPFDHMAIGHWPFDNMTIWQYDHLKKWPFANLTIRPFAWLNVSDQHIPFPLTTSSLLQIEVAFFLYPPRVHLCSLLRGENIDKIDDGTRETCNRIGSQKSAHQSEIGSARTITFNRTHFKFLRVLISGQRKGTFLVLKTPSKMLIFLVVRCQRNNHLSLFLISAFFS